MQNEFASQLLCKTDKLFLNAIPECLVVYGNDESCLKNIIKKQRIVNKWLNLSARSQDRSVSTFLRAQIFSELRRVARLHFEKKKRKKPTENPPKLTTYELEEEEREISEQANTGVLE